jgi:hypothetical protein
LDRSPQGVPEQFATELPDEGIATLRQEVIAQAIESIEFRAIQHFRLGFNRPIRQIAIPMAADGVETLQGKAVRIDAKVLDGSEFDGLDGLRDYLLTKRRDAFIR